MKAYRYMEDNFLDNANANFVKLFELDVIKITLCGFWVETPYDNKHKHFINNKSHKKYAHLNKNDALISFIKRKESQVSMYEYKLNIANKALMDGKALLNKDDE